MTSLDHILAAGRQTGMRPWPRAVVTREAWVELAQEFAAGRATLLGLWGEPAAVHMAILEESAGTLAVVTLECADGTFPSVGALHPPAIRLERAVSSLYGLTPAGALDTRPWLDLGFWGVTHPLGERRQASV